LNASQCCHIEIRGVKSHQSGIHGQLPMVPTDEQREEASRKLREFQQMHIKRIIDQREAKRAQEQLRMQASTNIDLKSVHRPHPQALTLTSASPPHSSSPSVEPAHSPSTLNLASSQTFVTPSKIMDEGDRDNLLDEISRESRLLSSMLDEDEDGTCFHRQGSLLSNNTNSPLSMQKSVVFNISDSTESQHTSCSLKMSTISISSSWIHGECEEQKIW